ncbi:MAG: 23S rRNA (adenine(2503)-C(2))-methyltransferase RlmN [Spirochaetia bacterium]
MVPVLSGLTPKQIASVLELKKPFRSKQIFRWLQNGVTDFFSMTNLPEDFRKNLSENVPAVSTKVNQVITSKDGSVKLQIQTHDNSMIETVILYDEAGRATCCLSSQLGCAVNCGYCKTGSLGFARNLRPDEIVEQVLHAEKHAGKIDNIVFMGMGEPLHNYQHLFQSIRVLTHPEGRGMSSRRITVSTAGVIPGIRNLAEDDIQVRLAVSLTSADQKQRESLIPIAKKYPLHELKSCLQDYQEHFNKRITLEMVLLEGINVNMGQIHALQEFANGLKVLVNLIPLNEVPGIPFNRPEEKEIHEFEKNLKKAGLKYTVRKSKGSEVSGACGQLGVLKNSADPSHPSR